MFRYLILASIIVSCAMPAVAQIDQLCEQACARDSAECHYERSRILLEGANEYSSDCMHLYDKTLKSMDNATRVQQSIYELDQSLADNSWTQEKRTSVQYDKATALIALAEWQLSRDDVSGGGVSLSQAADIYLSLTNSSTVAHENTDAIERATVGLLRCGRPVEALAALKSLPQNDNERMYLTAEILFTLGQREAAALEYEKWIAGGCVSKLAMLSQDEFGEAWLFFTHIKPKGQTKCQQLPSELRSRLESLQGEFAHPSNLPAKSYPAMPVPARIR